MKLVSAYCLIKQVLIKKIKTESQNPFDLWSTLKLLSLDHGSKFTGSAILFLTAKASSDVIHHRQLPFQGLKDDEMAVLIRNEMDSVDAGGVILGDPWPTWEQFINASVASDPSSADPSTADPSFADPFSANPSSADADPSSGIEKVEEFVATVGTCGALDPFSGIERIEEFVATVGMCGALKDVPFAFQTETGTTKDAEVAFKYQMKLLFKEKKFKELAPYMKRKYHALFAMAIRSKKKFQPQLQHFMFDREARKEWVDNRSAKYIAEDFWVRVGSDFTQQSNNWPAQICRGRPCNCFPTD